jgi:DNA-binding transcriptional MerR regulator
VRLKKTYSSREVAALTGLSARQLQVWDAGGLLSPTIPPHRTAAGGYTERRYTPIELFELLVLADLRQRGFTVRQLHTLLQVLHTQFGHRLFDATGGGLFNLLRMPAQPLLVVGDEGLLKDLGASIRPKRRRRVSGSGKSSRGRRPGAE